MAKIAKLIGGAGTGKTSELLRLMAQLLHMGYDPVTQIGFVSFTRAARKEAVERVVEELGVDQKELERHGNFRTLHSICYRATQVGKALLAGDADSRDWFKEQMGSSPPSSSSSSTDGDLLTEISDADSLEAVAMGLWDSARQRLVPLRDVYSQYAKVVGKRIWEDVKEWVDRYERQKWLTDRFDFTDILLRFAGLRADVDGYIEMDPQGEPPPVRVWFLDEWQDSSKLMNRVAARLINHWSTEYVYVAGDPFQAIYGFSGSNPHLFREMACDKQRVMPRSYRCAPPIMELGEHCLRQASDYWDRGIHAADHEGTVERVEYNYAPWMIKSDEEWLILARTNYQAKWWKDSLDKAGVVWAPTRGAGGFAAPAKRDGFIALNWIRDGAMISLAQWRRALDLIVAKGWLERGAKTSAADKSLPPDQRYWPKDLLGLGATPQLLEAIVSGHWTRFCSEDDCDRWLAAINTYGEALVNQPRVQVGTIHSAKGWGAQNVLLDCGSTRRIRDSASRSLEAADEECRISYVGVTRAKRRLVLTAQSRDISRGCVMPGVLS